MLIRMNELEAYDTDMKMARIDEAMTFLFFQSIVFIQFYQFFIHNLARKKPETFFVNFL